MKHLYCERRLRPCEGGSTWLKIFYDACHCHQHHHGEMESVADAALLTEELGKWFYN
jgi:hypothetical protein